MTDPLSGLIWLGSPAVRGRLRQLATGAAALTHEGLDGLAGGQGREYLRELLVHHGVLPARDKHLVGFERWVAVQVAAIEDPNDRQLVRAYLRWHHQRELSARAATGPLPETAVSAARAHTKAGLRLLTWLRSRGVMLSDCRQDDIDLWLATVSNPRQVSDFLTWAVRHRHCPRVVIPPLPNRSPAAGSSRELSQLLARLLGDDEDELADRVAGCLVVLFAQPINRISNFPLADIEIRGEEVWMSFGQESVPLPASVGALVVRLTSHRRNMATAANPASPWLFPGRWPGQPIRTDHLRKRLLRLGITSRSRVGAFRNLVSDVPAPVLAKALGYHPQTAARRAAEMGTDWANYAALKSRENA